MRYPERCGARFTAARINVPDPRNQLPIYGHEYYAVNCPQYVGCALDKIKDWANDKTIVSDVELSYEVIPEPFCVKYEKHIYPGDILYEG